MRPSPVTALLAACTLALVACHHEPSTPPGPDAGDAQPPTVTATTPAQGTTEVPTSTALTVAFSEPMKAGRGTVRVTAGDTEVSLPAGTWDTARRVLTVQPAMPLPPDSEVSVSVQADFTDEAGNALTAPFTFHFTTGSNGPRTSVSSSQPAEGTQGIYSVEMYYDGAASRPGVYLRKVLTVTFSGPMDASIAQVTLRNRTDPLVEPRVLTGQWSSNQRTLTVTVSAPEEGGPPLEDDSAYAMDLSLLRDAAGHLLDGVPSLGDGTLDFTTGTRNGELEHACTHTLINTAEELNAAPTPFAFPPSTDTGHTRYRLTLPNSDGSHQGYSELISAPDTDENVTLYLDRQVPLSVRNETEGSEVPVELHTTAPACANITHQARFTARAGDMSYMFHYGPADFATFEFVLERHGM
ncbi:Ig-like domain-containing protein [Vitiosangium sp. GDMCC 1.1324]|uniref:Ig-like domain-containing protein n=1 Tax=Vitiosangium sp. (strain GDMCC 1.1324) TaxID=2138576 RepID=UPI000D3393FC|nr:Ig-like domain-containing protein [Vitiosangium sp. GDMCC 1.1324]PTL80662.1 hypothetical protein DAT35_28990 [Vitiosangium sp. GDMCC 1.1324]